MRRIKLFIAMSLDGYIADKNGSVDWISGQDRNCETKDVYSEFIKNIDTILMGWNTYHQVLTELSPNNWVYQDEMTYVFTHRKTQDKKNIKFVNQNPVELIEYLKSKAGKDIWICGGANLIHEIMIHNLIDEYYISIIPTILGNGIRLFDESAEVNLRLIKTENYNGIVDVVYIRQ